MKCEWYTRGERAVHTLESDSGGSVSSGLGSNSSFHSLGKGAIRDRKTHRSCQVLLFDGPVFTLPGVEEGLLMSKR